MSNTELQNTENSLSTILDQFQNFIACILMDDRKNR